MWRVRCFCGKEFVILASRIVTGNTRSCGCLRGILLKEKIKKEGHMATKHGDSGTRLYNIWMDMKLRCTNENQKNYMNYGGRGITVCKEWRESYADFKKWAHESGYSDELTIDRVDNDGNYEPDNCRWATKAVQNRNKRLHQNNKSGTAGVRLLKNNKWIVNIKIDNEAVYVGTFEHNELESAIEARKQAELDYWGYTRIN